MPPPHKNKGDDMATEKVILKQKIYDDGVTYPAGKPISLDTKLLKRLPDNRYEKIGKKKSKKKDKKKQKK